MPDIFVSYAHVDDDPIKPVDNRWVTTFIDGLKTQLARHLGRADAYTLWMDDQLRGNQAITPEIHDKVAKAKTLLLFLSPGYVASQWCQEELKAFVDANQEFAGRLFIIELFDTERPERIKDMKGYRFWERDRSDRVRLLASPEPTKEDKLYFQKIDDLAHDLRDLLVAEREEVESGTQPSEDAEHTVYLAQTPDSLFDRREKVRRNLEQQGVRVLPKSRLPFANVEEAIDDALAQSDLYVQLLDQDSGQQLPHFQYERCRATDLPVLQWRERDLDLSAIADEKHSELLNGENVVVSTLVDFSEMIKKRLFAPPPVIASNGSDLLFYIDAAQDDIDLAYETSTELEDHGVGFSLPLTPDAQTPPSAIRKDFETNVLNCDVVLMIYRKGPLPQLRERLLQCNRLRAKRDGPFRMLAVCTEPEMAAPLNIHLPGMKVFDAPSPCPSNCAKAVLAEIDQ